MIHSCCSELSNARVNFDIPLRRIFVAVREFSSRLLRCLHSRMSSCHFPEKSAYLNASHETGLCVLGLPQEKEPAGRLRQGLPQPDISSRISLHYVPSLCRWHVQWKMPEGLEQMPLFLLHPSVVLALVSWCRWSCSQ